MPLARTVQSLATGVGVSSVATGSFTPPDNSLLVVVGAAVQSSNGGLQGSSFGITDSVGLTWTSRVLSAAPTRWGVGLRVWTAPVTTGVSMTVTVNVGVLNANRLYAQAISYTGYDTTTPTGSTATGTNTGSGGAQTITLSAAPASTSEVLGIVSSVSSGTQSVTPGSGWTEILDVNNPNWACFQMQRRDSSISDQVPWADLDETGTVYEAMLAALEIRAAGGGGFQAAWARGANQLIGA
jgi:hypothetical protein